MCAGLIGKVSIFRNAYSTFKRATKGFGCEYEGVSGGSSVGL